MAIPKGMDIVGPLPQAKVKVRFLLVLTDYFSKWVKAKVYAHIREGEVIKFLTKNIICRFVIL